jgi:glycosyltransferase involved in cell wall biosynthesis
MRIAVVGPAEPRELCDLLGLERDGIPVGLGGTPVTALVRALVNRGHFVYLVTASKSVSSPWRFRSSGLQVSVVPYRSSAKARGVTLFRSERQALLSELARAEIDVVHAHWTYEFGWAGIADGRPCVLTTHDSPWTVLRHMPDIYRLVRLLMAIRVRLGARCVTAVSPYLARRWKRQMLYWRPIEVVPNISPALKLSDVVARAGNESNVIVDIANGSRLKNVRVLVRAFARVRESLPAARLVLVGPGLSEYGNMAAWARRRGLDDCVSFLGELSRDDVAGVLGSAALLCHPSREESQGMVFIEAMSMRRAVMGGRRSGGVAWTLFEGRAGYLTDIRRPDILAKTISDALGPNREKTAALALEGQRLASVRYSGEVVAARYESVYSRLVAVRHSDFRIDWT